MLPVVVLWTVDLAPLPPMEGWVLMDSRTSVTPGTFSFHFALSFTLSRENECGVTTRRKMVWKASRNRNTEFAIFISFDDDAVVTDWSGVTHKESLLEPSKTTTG